MASMTMMREYVTSQYGGGWPQKVARMPDFQVVAIYKSMTRRPKKDISGKKDGRDKEGFRIESWRPETARQITMFEGSDILYEGE